jgi:D-hydroxyproline dehydrogenase subunit alpha
MGDELSTDVLVVGGGPAGMASAIQARDLGLSVTLVDEQPRLGGQYYRDFPPGYLVASRKAQGHRYATGRALADRVLSSGTGVLLNTTVYALGPGWAALDTDEPGPARVEFAVVILATGAYDRPVPFPGWTLPGVMTAGGAQALIKAQRIVPGQRVIMAGSGPLTLAFSAQMARYGTNLIGVFEAARSIGTRTVARYAGAWPGNGRVLAEGLASLAYLRYRGIPVSFAHRVVRTEGDRQVERAVVAQVDENWLPIAGTEVTLDADAVCLGYGFLSANELARSADCQHSYLDHQGGLGPVMDEWLRTSVRSVLVAGDGALVRGAGVAAEEGRLAAVTAALDLGKLHHAQALALARPIRRRLARLARLVRANAVTFPVGSGLYRLAAPDTIVCRCEDVTADQITRRRPFEGGDVNLAKARTRAGMGRCQGRNCQWQIAALLQSDDGPGSSTFTSRQPVKPVRIESIVRSRS